MDLSNKLRVYLWDDPRANNCNTIVIDGQVPLLIDPGHSFYLERLFARMKADGLEPEKIKCVMATHAHPDHVEGVKAFEKPSVRIGMPKEEESFIDEIGRPMFQQHGLDAPDFRVDFYVGEGALTIGKHEFETFLAPGHSPASLCIYWPRHRVLIAGDVIFAQGVGRSDFPGGDSKKLKESVERLSRLPVDLLIPGHGPMIQGADRVRANFDYVKRAYFPLL